MTEKDEATSVEATPRVLNLILADRIIREVDGRYGAVGYFPTSSSGIAQSTPSPSAVTDLNGAS